jgi:cytoskeletal protein RodZ
MTEPNPAPPNQQQQESSSKEESSPSTLFSFMANRPLMFLVFIPILWIVIVLVGFAEEEKVENSVENIWTRQRSDLSRDKEYARSLDRTPAAATFAAMAVSRDGTNLFTSDRLEEIRARMEQTESTTVRSI